MMSTEFRATNPAWPKAKEKKSKPGTFEAKGIDPKTGKRHSYYGKSEYEASYRAAVSLGLTMIEDNSLHSYTVFSYWPTVKMRSDNWKEQIRWAYDNFIGPRWGGIELRDIRRRDVQMWFNKLAQEEKVVDGRAVGLKLMPSSIRRIKIVFSAILNLALDDELIEINPVAKVRTETPEPPKKRALSAYELQCFIRSTPEHLIPTVLFMASGMRIGEACGPQVSHIVNLFGYDGIQVEQQVIQPRGGAELSKKLKTPQSNRFLPMPKKWLDQIRNAPRVSSIFLSSSEKGGYLLPSNVYDEFTAIYAKAGIEKVSPHELRHTFISLLENELEAPEAIVAKLAGRKSRGVNRDYSKASVDQLARWMESYVQLIEDAKSNHLSTICTTNNVVRNA